MAVLPTSCAMVLAAESKPSDASTNSLTMLPSMPQGTPTTAVATCWVRKCSARYAASVLVRAPPTSTKPVSWSSSQAFRALASSSGLPMRSTVRPRSSRPPVPRYASQSSDVSSMQCFSKSPFVPPTKPRTLHPGLALSMSTRPHTRSWQPGACRPQNTTPTTCPSGIVRLASEAAISTRGSFTCWKYFRMICSCSKHIVVAPSRTSTAATLNSERAAGNWCLRPNRHCCRAERDSTVCGTYKKPPICFSAGFDAGGGKGLPNSNCSVTGMSVDDGQFSMSNCMGPGTL
mmetsp:Transcript_25613/g.70416  ORF Transcript_25613/g.70416 Transcript_25613/m.70416 type:complete len:289 (-) Transcript_25613:1673-2539(-)